MSIGDIINDSFGLLTKQLRFYCWHFKRNLNHKQREELTDLLYEQHFERLASKIRSLNDQSLIADCKQQIGKLLFEHCLRHNRRHQVIQLVESGLVDIDVRLDNYGRTLLHRTAYNLDVDLVRILIDNGVNIKLRDYAGNTALHIAIQSYRNGAILFGDGPDVVENLTTIIELLLEADKTIQHKQHISKLNTTTNQNDQKQAWLVNPTIANPTQDIMYAENLTTNQQQSHNDKSDLASTRKQSSNINQNIDRTSDQSSLPVDDQNQSDSVSKNTNQTEESLDKVNPILLEDYATPLVNTKNAFGRTALHYCVLVVGEQHLSHFVKLLISFGADTDAIDTRMKTPLYCLVKRTGVSAIRQKCSAITQLLESGCDDLGLAIEPKSYFDDKLIKELEDNIANIMQPKLEGTEEPIFMKSTFKRVPKLKHLSRLRLVKLQDEKIKLKRQTKLSLPSRSPKYLNTYVNRRLLDQTELF